MTSDDKPLRLTRPRKKHAAGASRRLAFGISAAAASALASFMADAQAGESPPAAVATTTTTSLEPLIVHVQVTRLWRAPVRTGPPRSTSPPAATAPQAPRAAQPAPVATTTPAVTAAPVVTAAPRTVPPTTVSRAS